MPPTDGRDFQTFVTRVQLIGRSSGRVKQLKGFDRSRHTVPDAVNAATSNFLARLCAAELADEAEERFQQARAELKYKRKELSLEVSPPTAVLTAKDFLFELGYALEEREPETFVVTRTLHQVRDAEVVQRPEFDRLFAAQFSEVSFVLRQGVKVEAVIDAVEALDDDAGMQVDYPSDYRHCTLRVDGVDAAVRCDGASLTMEFPRPGSPRELLEAFAAVREAFALSRQRTLGGLLG